MAISSIHFAAGHSGYFDHNSREAETNNAIFKDEKNYCSANKKEAFEFYKSKYKIETTGELNKIIKLSTCSYINARTHPTNQRYYIIANLIPIE